MDSKNSSNNSPNVDFDGDLPIIGNSIYNEDAHLRPEFIEHILQLVKNLDRTALIEELDKLHSSELGDLLEALNSTKRMELVNCVGDQFDMIALTEVEDAIREEIIDNLPNADIAVGLSDLDSDDAVYILEDMDAEDQTDVLKQMPFDEQLLIKRHLEYPEESVGRRMQSEMIAVPPFWTIGQTIDYMRDDENLPDRFHEIFVVSPGYELQGSIQLDRLLRAQRKIKVDELMEENRHQIQAGMDQEEAALVFQQYDLLSAAVVDEGNRLVGVMTIDDIVDVITDAAEEDIKLLAGVGDEELSDSILEITKSRFLWLFINLGTAILASIVIGFFDATIQQMVALAILMPIVASMGGNAGTQTMTVAVRALGQKDIDSYNVKRIIFREIAVGFVNGFAFALIVGVVAAYWFSNADLGVIIGFAMIFNMICAAFVGIMIPIALDKLDIDPAIASSVFVTTVTDIVGFFAFLGMAAWWFGLG